MYQINRTYIWMKTYSHSRGYLQCVYWTCKQNFITCSICIHVHHWLMADSHFYIETVCTCSTQTLHFGHRTINLPSHVLQQRLLNAQVRLCAAWYFVLFYAVSILFVNSYKTLIFHIVDIKWYICGLIQSRFTSKICIRIANTRNVCLIVAKKYFLYQTAINIIMAGWTFLSAPFRLIKHFYISLKYYTDMIMHFACFYSINKILYPKV